jgi:uncharacterized protein YgiM (DUF1202 family)
VVVDDDDSQEIEESEAAAVPAPEPVPPNPRQVRARRRRRRRQLGTVLFLLVAVGVFAAAYFTLTEGDDSSDDATGTTGVGATTTTLAPFAGSYKVTTGVNLREGAGTTFPAVSTIETGHAVLVVCVVEGEPVNAPSGTNTQWLKITGLGPTGYVSSAFVTLGDDLRNGKIPACPPA